MERLQAEVEVRVTLKESSPSSRNKKAQLTKRSDDRATFIIIIVIVIV